MSKESEASRASDSRSPQLEDNHSSPSGGEGENTKAKAHTEERKVKIEPEVFDAKTAPGTYQSDLGMFLDTTATRVSHLPESGGEWAVIIARRRGNLEIWALSPESSVALSGRLSRRRGFDFALGVTAGILLYFVCLVYL